MIDPGKVQGVIYPFASIGYGINELDAFDDAEVNAGIEALNAIKYTSFVPVGPKGRWKIDDNQKLPTLIKRGDALPMAFEDAYATNSSVAAAIAIGLNEDQQKPGLIMEYADTNFSENELEAIAIRSLERAFERRKHLGWKLDEVVTKKIGGSRRKDLTTCALVGAIYIPESI